MTESIPSNLQSPDCTLSNILASPSDSAISPADAHRDATISSLVETSADQLEVHCSLLEQNIQLSSKVHELKAHLSICEQHNLKLGADCSQLQSAISAFHTQVQPIPLAMDFPPLKTEDNSSTLVQRALTIYQAVVDDFRATTLHRHFRGFIPYNDNYAAACEDWRDRFPDVSPPPWDEQIDEWVLNIECYPVGSGRGISSYASYVKILDPLRDQEGCLELSDEIPRRC